jgi:Phosphotransferase enzyme family
MSEKPVSELLARASSRVRVQPGDGRSGSVYERAVIDGQPYFVKSLSPASDWLMRLTGDHVHRPYLVWQAGIMAAAPGCIDHTVVAMEVAGDGADAVLTMLMRDVGRHLVPEGDAVVRSSQHEGFIAHLADLCGHFWGWPDTIGLTTMAQRIRFFAPDNIAAELKAADLPGPIAAADQGWRDLPARAPALASLAAMLHDDPGIVTRPLASTPGTFLHGDWKMGNLGSHPDGRTILLDWAYPGAGPACWDLCWYLALNQARLPESKEATIDRFRAAIGARGLDPGGWWDAQLDLCMMAIMAAFGWEKALGDKSELDWWEARATSAAARQGIAIPPLARHG